MVWGYFTHFGVGPLVRLEGRLAAKDYINLLEMHLMPLLETLSEEMFTFQYDNAPIHTAKKTSKWKLDSNIPFLPWPPQSPDINPIEHLWDELERKIRRHRTLPKTKMNYLDFCLKSGKIFL